jgi:hypothetical protein
VLCSTDNVLRLRHSAAICRICGVLCSGAAAMGFCINSGYANPLKSSRGLNQSSLTMWPIASTPP